MSGFLLIVGSGHNGSKWLAQALNHPAKGLRFHHELKWATASITGGWPAISRYEAEKGVNASAFTRYWQKIDTNLAKYRYVGDANAFSPCIVPEVHAARPVAGIIYLIRNGIQVVHSLATKSATCRNAPLTNWAVDGNFRRYWELAGRPYKGRWGEWARWERICLWWAASAFMPGWLRKKMPDVPLRICRLEDLINGGGTLASLLSDFGLSIPMSRLRQLQKRDVNRKVRHKRTPPELWARWTPVQRQAFRAICGEAMEAYDYRIPA